ncbi:MAG: helix-turn-helix domain-containing protein [Cyanobacteria bacterium K_Offshore_surface_m2_239]|nr:helix-turn-helix domain-containing protein [Cyanobacteria bacterium K_Offshore_surface_m2_239]
MQSQSPSIDSHQGAEQLIRLIEEAYHNSNDQQVFIQEILGIITGTTTIRDIRCEIEELVISTGVQQRPLSSSRSQGEGTKRLSTVDEAVYKAEWTSEPTYQTTPGTFSHRQSSRSEQAITYADRIIGRLDYKPAEAGDDRETEQQRLATASRYIAYTIQRKEISRWSQERLGRAYPLIGASKQIHAVEQLIERASRSLLPVLIEGEFGTEKLSIAISLHASGKRKDGPFIDIDCGNPNLKMENYLEQAKSGSLCLNNIEHLNRHQQMCLQSLIHSHLGQWVGKSTADEVRIISLSNISLRDLVKRGQFLPTLYAELSILNIHVPALRERKKDIQPMVNHLISELTPVGSFRLQEEIWPMLQSYPWPGNLYEMKKLIASFVLLSDGGELSGADLLAHAPWLAQAGCGRDGLEPTESALDLETEGSMQLENWLEEFLLLNAAAKESMHDGLRRAIRHLLTHFAEPISLNDLAQVAHLSASHLSFLFRESVNASFKDVQQCIRISKAKELLRQRRQLAIAEIAAEVGYADLSHFERSFRRRVGMRPRDYRRSTGQGTPSDE